MKQITLVLAGAAAFCLCGSTLADTRNTDKGQATMERKASPSRASASSGTSTAPAAAGIDLEQAFKHADIDGDGAVSKAEAAGNERLIKGFDKADKNRDGKLSREEFDSLYRGKAKPADRAAVK